MVTTSVVALGVRKGNPKGIKGWEDLTKPGIEVLYPSPKTSGGAMWDIIAIYGAGLKLGKQRGQSDREAEHYAIDLLTQTQRNVKVMDKSGRESVTTFERGVGDVIVTYENELAPRIKQGRPYELIIPNETVLVENPIAIVDRNVDRHHVRDIAQAFIAFLHDEEAAGLCRIRLSPDSSISCHCHLCIVPAAIPVVHDFRAGRMGQGLCLIVQPAGKLVTRRRRTRTPSVAG
jgi:ABC-type sulfate transport system substrate-binding protein